MLFTETGITDKRRYKLQDLNKLFLIGRLTKDIGSDPNGRDFGYTQSGTCKAVVSIASNLSKKDQNG